LPVRCRADQRPKTARLTPPLQDWTRELDKQAVASCLDNAPLVFRDLGRDEFATVRSEPVEGSSLILAHKAAITGDIGGEDCHEPTFDPLSAQNVLSDPKDPLTLRPL
jgi:hypothetical protein